MSNTTRAWTIGIIILIVIVILGWLYFYKSDNKNAMQNSTATTTENAVATTSIATDISSSTDTSDTALDQDLLNVDTQINGLNTDSSNIDQTLK